MIFYFCLDQCLKISFRENKTKCLMHNTPNSKKTIMCIFLLLLDFWVSLREQKVEKRQESDLQKMGIYWLVHTARCSFSPMGTLEICQGKRWQESFIVMGLKAKKWGLSCPMWERLSQHMYHFWNMELGHL